MRVYTENNFDASHPEDYKWWHFVEPIEVKCAAFIIIEQLTDVPDDLKYGLRQGLNALAMVAVVEKGDWGK